MKVIITGGTGFIGTNAAARHLRNGDDVVVIDNLSRTGAHANLAWLRSKGRFCFVELDIRDANRVAAPFEQQHDATPLLQRGRRRLATVWGRGPGMGRMVHYRGAPAAMPPHLWGRQTSP